MITADAAAACRKNDRPGRPSCLKLLLAFVRPRQAQIPAILDHSSALAQGDGRAGPALDRGAVGRQRDLIVLDAGDVLHDAFAVRRPAVDAEGEVISRRGHLRPLLPQSSSSSRFTAGAAGFFIFSQSGERPERYIESLRFDTMPSSPILQAWAKTVGPSPSMCSLSRMPGRALPSRGHRPQALSCMDQ